MVGIVAADQQIRIIEGALVVHKLLIDSVSISGNVIVGVNGWAILIKGFDCSNPSAKAAYLLNFNSNSAGSSRMGLGVTAPNSVCLGLSNYTAYKNA